MYNHVHVHVDEHEHDFQAKPIVSNHTPRTCFLHCSIKKTLLKETTLHRVSFLKLYTIVSKITLITIIHYFDEKCIDIRS